MAAFASYRQQMGFWIGPGLFCLVLFLPAGDMSGAAQAVAAVTVLMATWWIAEVLPLAATALLPLVLFPLLDVTPVAAVSAAYAHHLVFLFLGGFMIAVTLERWQLHRRLALLALQRIGDSPARLLFGFMLVTAFLSMWISNTATVLMMVPIASAIASRFSTTDTAGKTPALATPLLLGIAYAASIGGIATLIGTPPNAILAAMVESHYDITISFAGWMAFGLPFATVFLLLAWLYLKLTWLRGSWQSNDAGADVIDTELRQLGRLSQAEWRVLIVFLCVAAAWVLRGFVPFAWAGRIGDSTIAVAGALALFMLPAGDGRQLLDWDSAKTIPWGVLLLFGGGFALASGFEDSGLSVWIGERLLVFEHAGPVLMVALTALLVKFLTEVTSNTATASLLIPIMAGLGEAIGIEPLILMTTTAVSASLAFMLPVATPPNAIVFATPYVSVPIMARAGLWLNLLALPVTTLFIVLLLPLVWDIPLLR